MEMAISRCMQIFESGGVVALPTDTLYGVVTTISNSDKLYKLKHRNRLKPLGLFVSNIREIQRLISLLTEIMFARVDLWCGKLQVHQGQWWVSLTVACCFLNRRLFTAR